MTINYIIRSFPHKTETFIVLHVLWLIDALKNLKIYTNSYRGYDNYTDEKLLKDYNVEKYILENKVSKTGIKKIIWIIKLLSSFRLLKYSIKYYKFKPEKSFQNIYNLYYYKGFDVNNVTHVQFNTSLYPLIDLIKIGYIKTDKIIISFHGYDAFRLSKNNYLRRYKEIYDKSVSFVTVNSNYVKKHLISVGVSEKKIKIIPVGINLDLFNTSIDLKKSIDTRHIKIVTTGRLIQMKGHEYAIKAVKILKELDYTVEYKIIGSGLQEYENKLNELVKNLGCEDEVSFLGSKSQKEIKTILLNSDVFWMPSTYDNNTFREEALGVSAIEAQACGLPVIGFETGGIPEAVLKNQTGILVEDRNSDELVHETIKLLKDKVRYYNYSINARARVLQFYNNENLFKEYYELYKKLS